MVLYIRCTWSAPSFPAPACRSSSRRPPWQDPQCCPPYRLQGSAAEVVQGCSACLVEEGQEDQRVDNNSHTNTISSLQQGLNFFSTYNKGIPVSGDEKIQTLGTPTAVQEVNTSHLAKKISSTLVKYRPKRSKEIFQIRFWTSGSAPTGKHALSLSCVFRLGDFLRSKIESESIFLTKYYIITILKSKKLERFGLYLTNSKKWISHCIFKSCAEGFRVLFSSQEANFFAHWLVFTY